MLCYLLTGVIPVSMFLLVQSTNTQFNNTAIESNKDNKGYSSITSRLKHIPLEEYLKTFPDLWESRPVTKQEILRYKSMLGSRPSPANELRLIAGYSQNHRKQLGRQILPTHFDARDKWRR